MKHDLQRVLEDGFVVFPVEEMCPRQPYARDPMGLRRCLADAGVPFVGSPPGPASIARDKARAKGVLRAAGLRVPAGYRISGHDGIPGYGGLDTTVRRYAERFGFPAVVKPVHGSDSIGVSIVDNATELHSLARRGVLDSPQGLVVEQFIDGLEVSVWALGTGTNLKCHRVIIVPKLGRLYDCRAKAGRALPRTVTASGATPGHRPVSGSHRDAAADAALRAHRALGLFSYSRTDMVIDRDGPVVLEVNPTPHLRPTGSMSISPDGHRSFGPLMADLVSHAYGG